jgi:hypothetical protein
LEHTRVSFALLPIRTRSLHGLAALSTVDWRKELALVFQRQNIATELLLKDFSRKEHEVGIEESY